MKTLDKSFTNNIGQTIEPGEHVVMVTSGCGHSVITRQGIYLGLYNGKPQCSYVLEQRKYTVDTPEGIKILNFVPRHYSHCKYTMNTYATRHTTTLRKGRVYAIKRRVIDVPKPLISESKEIPTRSDLIQTLHDKIINVKFTKSNGEIRSMNCTMNLDIIPPSEWPTSDFNPAVGKDSLRVFDTDISEWRAFVYDRVIEVSYK